MFSKIKIRLNQSDSPEYVKAEMMKNEILWNLNETAQPLHSRLLVPQPFIKFAIINLQINIEKTDYKF